MHGVRTPRQLRGVQIMNDVVEFFVSNDRMDLIRSHRWEATGDGKVHATLREWTWNYRTESYTEDRHTFALEATPDGVVTHDGRPLTEYAKARVDTLTGKRAIHKPTVERVA